MIVCFGLVWTLGATCPSPASRVWAAGSLTIEAIEEKGSQPAVTRLEVYQERLDGRPLIPRKAVSAGIGVVLDRSLELNLRDGDYAFRAARGPEYRIVTGRFTLQRDSLDRHSVPLPRMAHLRNEGWTSGDCWVPDEQQLPLRMAAEDLHLAAIRGAPQLGPIAGRGPDDALGHGPLWITGGLVGAEGLAFFPVDSPGTGPDRRPEPDPQPLPVERLAGLDRADRRLRVGVTDPFAWPLPVWLASRRVDGFFLLGDWLNPATEVRRIRSGRDPDPDIGVADGREIGYRAEKVYWNLLEAGFSIVPLAGSGPAGDRIPVGYNRLYVANPHARYEGDYEESVAVGDADAWWRAAWRGHSVATNGPLLRPRLAGRLPGHRFRGGSGERLELYPELDLTVRDPVRYLEVIHNGRVHYSARLDEFAAAGGKIPPIIAESSGWVLVRVVTEISEHFRAAVSAPWFIDFPDRPRVTRTSVRFFRQWLADYEQRLLGLPPHLLARHVPYVRAARAFWAAKEAEATDP